MIARACSRHQISTATVLNVLISRTFRVRGERVRVSTVEKIVLSVTMLGRFYVTRATEFLAASIKEGRGHRR